MGGRAGHSFRVGLGGAYSVPWGAAAGGKVKGGCDVLRLCLAGCARVHCPDCLPPPAACGRLIHARSASDDPPLPTGRITVNGEEATAANHRQAYVEQQDQFYSMLTGGEAGAGGRYQCFWVEGLWAQGRG
jgi:hypothetical protein